MMLDERVFESSACHTGRVTPAFREMRLDERDTVRSLILEGLREHWGTIDETLNPDLDDLRTAYANGVVLVATESDEIIGTGTIVRRDDRCAEIVRMSVAPRHRRAGLGRMLISELVVAAERWDVDRIVVETTASWAEVVRFYERCGFTLTHFVDGEFGRDAWFELKLVR